MSDPIQLSNRERQVVSLLLQGKSNKMIAAALGIANRTVEFHLKNIYTKYQVSSRVELILKLGKATGSFQAEKLRHSTVVRQRENAENKDTISLFSKETEMKNLLTTKHVLVGVATALLAGFVWVVLYRYFVHMSTSDIQTWIIPAGIAWALSGLLVGWIGKRNDNSLLKVAFSTLIGTGLAPISILPLMGFVILPLAKFAEWLGLINSAAIPRDIATTLAIIAMVLIWLLVATVIGTVLLFVTVKRFAPGMSPIPTAEQGR